MSCYVDNVTHQFGRMKMCHLWADTEAELLAMVDKIGVDRKWIQGHQTLSFGKHKKASWVHFDISLSKKALALQAGAILTDKYGPVEHIARQRLAAAEAAGDLNGTIRQRERLALIASIRDREPKVLLNQQEKLL